VKFTRLELLALDAGLQLLALARAGRAVLAELARVLAVLVLVALALAALTGPVSGTKLTDMFTMLGNAGFRADFTFAGSVVRMVVFRKALTLAANTGAVIRS